MRMSLFTPNLGVCRGFWFRLVKDIKMPLGSALTPNLLISACDIHILNTEPINLGIWM